MGTALLGSLGPTEGSVSKSRTRHWMGDASLFLRVFYVLHHLVCVFAHLVCVFAQSGGAFAPSGSGVFASSSGVFAPSIWLCCFFSVMFVFFLSGSFLMHC
ncbi:unnamed protein product [Laminaria digitata]